MSDDLKPCPFCGGYAIGSCEDVGENKTFWACEVFCTDCYASTRRCYGPDSDGNEDDADAEAREEWNRRIEALEARAEKAEAERDALRDVAKQAIDVIESVQTYPQPDDPTDENALTMREHEVFGFDVESARAALNREPE